MPSSHLILCHPLFLLPPIPPSIRVFSSESTLRMRWPKYWSFSFSIIPFKEIPGLISFRLDWLDLLAVQGTLKSLPQHPSSEASFLQHSAFFTVQLSHPYMTTGKTKALTRQTFVGKVMSLLLNMLSRLVITFLPRTKRLIYFNWRIITLQCWGGFLPYIDRNNPWVHMCPPILNPLPLPSPCHPSGLSQCTGFECPTSCIKLALITYFTYGNIHVSVVFSQIIPPSSSPT